MRIILGIGNPGSRYINTRHNIGFMLLDYFAAKNNLSFCSSEKDYQYAVGRFEDFTYALVKPSTYVNLSGEAALGALQKFDSSIEDILVLADDINLPTGKIRVRMRGGDGGHNGMNSIIYHLESDEFPRMRFGIGNDFEKGFMAEYVLSKFTKEELTQLEGPFDAALSLIECFIHGGGKAMLDLNSKNK